MKVEKLTSLLGIRRHLGFVVASFDGALFIHYVRLGRACECESALSGDVKYILLYDP